MTIKQQGGIFGRNPSFNDVDANSLNVDGTITSDGLTVDGTTSLEDVTVSLDDTTSADSMPALDPSGSELLIKNTNNSADYTGIRLTTRTSAAGSWVIANEFAGSYKGDLVFHARDGGSSSADKITFTNAGSIKINTSGQGIDFSATSGTGTSELFDDYEEGTFSPTFTTDGTDFDSVTYDAITDGKYVKIGSMVYVQIMIRTDAITVGSATGNVLIGGLPFTSSTGGQADSAGELTIGQASAWAGDVPFSAEVLNNSTSARLWYRTAVNGSTTNVAIADLDIGSNKNLIRLSGSYIAA